MKKKTNKQRFGELVLYEFKPHHKNIQIETEDGECRIRLDYDDVDDVRVRAFAEALVNLWNEQP